MLQRVAQATEALGQLESHQGFALGSGVVPLGAHAVPVQTHSASVDAAATESAKRDKPPGSSLSSSFWCGSPATFLTCLLWLSLCPDSFVGVSVAAAVSACLSRLLFLLSVQSSVCFLGIAVDARAELVAVVVFVVLAVEVEVVADAVVILSAAAKEEAVCCHDVDAEG